MSIYVYESIESAIEVCIQYLLMLTIDRDSHTRRPSGVAVLVAVSAAVTTISTYFELSSITIFYFLTYTLMLFLLSDQSLPRTLMNASLSGLGLFLLEFAGLTVFRQIFGEDFAEDHRLVLLLLGIVLLVSLGMWRFVPESPLRRLWISGKLPLAVLLCGDIALFMTIVTSLWNRDKSAFFADFGSILLQIALFCVFACTLGYLLVGYASQHARNKVMAEYNALLEQTMEDMRQREHEYKNELNVIIGIAEHREPYSLDMIRNYAEQLYAETKSEPGITLVKDNTVVSFLLLRYKQMADRQETPFTAKVCEPFPAYPVSEKDLMELVSNLMNNALEATSELPAAQRSVLISFAPSGITVENTFAAVDGDYSSLERLADRGRSTKGRDRGYGLSNVMKIADKYRLKRKMFVEDQKFSFWVGWKG